MTTIERPVLHSYTVPVHTPTTKAQRRAGAGLTIVSEQTIVARDADQARHLAEDVVRAFAGKPEMQVFSFRSEVTEVQPKMKET